MCASTPLRGRKLLTVVCHLKCSSRFLTNGFIIFSTPFTKNCSILYPHGVARDPIFRVVVNQNLRPNYSSAQVNFRRVVNEITYIKYRESYRFKRLILRLRNCEFNFANSSLHFDCRRIALYTIFLVTLICLRECKGGKYANDCPFNLMEIMASGIR